MHDENKIKGIDIDKDEGACIIAVNPKIYSLDVIYSASYVFTDRTYVMIDGDPEKEIKITLKPKEDCDLVKLGGEFSNALLNYTVYKKQSEKNKGVREAIMQRALITNDPSVADNNELFDDEVEGYLDDPEGIAIPWEEKYDKDKK